MTNHRRWRVVYEPDVDSPWIVQVATTEAWLDWRRFNNEEDGRRFMLVRIADQARGAR